MTLENPGGQNRKWWENAAYLKKPVISKDASYLKSWVPSESARPWNCSKNATYLKEMVKKAAYFEEMPVI